MACGVRVWSGSTYEVAVVPGSWALGHPSFTQLLYRLLLRGSLLKRPSSPLPYILGAAAAFMQFFALRTKQSKLLWTCRLRLHE